MTKARTHGKRLANRRKRADGGDESVLAAQIANEGLASVDPVFGVPTPEQFRHGCYEQGGAERGGRIVWRNRHVSPLRTAQDRGKLTARQVAAGERYEEAYRGAEMPTGPRSCLDNTVHGRSDHIATGYIDAVARWRAVVREVGMARAAVLSSVCVRHEPIGDCRPTRRRFRLLLEGLNVVADHWGLATE